MTENDLHPRQRLSILDSEISFVDSGEGRPIVFLHGNPTSSYVGEISFPMWTGLVDVSRQT